MAERRVKAVETTQPADQLVTGDLSNEEWREYDWEYLDTRGQLTRRIYRIVKPQRLYYRRGGTTHRVVDTIGQVVHLVPAPGHLGCVLRWSGPVEF